MHATIADVIADTAQNSIEAGAGRVTLSIVEKDGTISVRIADNGKGMDEATLAKAFDPFYTEPGKHSGRRVGLGLPILKQICESTGGGVKLDSRKGEGTVLEYSFAADSIDLPPMGSLADAILMLFNYPGDFELEFSHERGGESYAVSRSELSEACGGLERASGLALAREFLVSQEEALAAAGTQGSRK